MNELTSWGVDAIITDFPERSREKQNQQLLE